MIVIVIPRQPSCNNDILFMLWARCIRVTAHISGSWGPLYMGWKNGPLHIVFPFQLVKARPNLHSNPSGEWFVLLAHNKKCNPIWIIIIIIIINFFNNPRSQRYIWNSCTHLTAYYITCCQRVTLYLSVLLITYLYYNFFLIIKIYIYIYIF